MLSTQANDDGSRMVWMGKNVHFDVQGIQGPPTLDFAPLLQASIEVEEDMLSQNSFGDTSTDLEDSTSCSARRSPPLALLHSGTSPFQTNLAAIVDTEANPQTRVFAKRIKQSSKNFRRSMRRLEKVIYTGHIIRSDVFKRFVLNSVPTPTNLDFSILPVKNGAYSAGTFKMPNASEELTVESALKMGLTYVPWDGINPAPYFDCKGRLSCIMAGRPNDPSFLAAASAVYNLLALEGQSAAFRKSQLEHPRGSFPAVNVGITHGIGTLEPVNLQNHDLSDLVDRLLADENLQRLATFGSTCFALWAPKIYKYYKDHLDALFKEKPDLRRIFAKSVFPTAAFNFGPNVWTFKHRDVMNCPFGFCAIQALGSFDPKKGGHIILWELGLIVEFPPGSLILIPSATITHSNIPVAPGEARSSFMQYAAGGLFRFVDCGFRTEADLKKENFEEYVKMCHAKTHRWQDGLELLTKLKELWPDFAAPPK